jgi:mannose-6-phosphate isomerase-like protein (cupin superfamily)
VGAPSRGIPNGEADLRRQEVNVFGADVYLTMPRAAGRTEVSLLEATAPGDGPPLHVHHNGDEISRVLKGRFRLRIGPGRQVRQPGGRAARPGASDRNPKKLNAPRDTNSSP